MSFGVRLLTGANEMNESQIYKQIVENLAQIDDDIARLRHQHLMLRVDIQILLEKYKCLKSCVCGYTAQ